MRSFKETLKQEFPRTPESFRQCVNNAVAEERSGGTRYAPDELHMNSFRSPETRNPETGWIEFEQSFEIRNFDSSSEFIKIIPFEDGFDEEGAYIEGTETLREDMGFAVQF